MSKPKLLSVANWLAAFAILGVAAFLLVPAMHCSPKRARRIACANNLKQVGLAIKLYERDHDGSFPSRLGTLAKYVSQQNRLLVCPAKGTVPGAFRNAERWTDYAYVPGLTASASNAVLAYCHPKNHDGDGANILFVDGHVEWFNAKKYSGGEPSFEDIVGTIGERPKP